MQDFRKLKVWEKAHHLTLFMYSVTRDFPKEEIYGLTSQIRRSAASIPANIAEGCGRGNREFHHHLRIALGSATELEYHLILVNDLRYLSSDSYDKASGELVEIKKMLTSLMKAIAQSQRRKL